MTKRTQRNLLVAVVLGLLASALGGCQLFTMAPDATPRQRYASLSEIYIDSVDVLTAARVSGLIDDDAAGKVRDVRLAANRYLDRVKQALDRGAEPDELALLLDEAAGYVRDLQKRAAATRAPPSR